ncbi:DUF6843 domain-containing protein [Paenibacillus bovis]|uniref:DUF6843 domain-containing protein n=1 Tax=Paenibacillus bovis TaxID=1616788 RepID=A0A172ZE64_9BACL|nr:hypothetical protein [Paenibacillus bovis]ANF95793.1 hypothetical protein AR543_07095 [Paenibacillus bovis]
MKDSTRQRTGFILLAALSLITIIILSMIFTNSRRASVYLIPENYRGWVQIIYNQQSYPPIDISLTKATFRIGSDGVLRTSTPEVSEGIAEDQYYWIDAQGERTPIDTQKLIHGKSVRSSGTDGTEQDSETVAEEFFVGTEEAYKQTPAPSLEDHL